VHDSFCETHFATAATVIAWHQLNNEWYSKITAETMILYDYVSRMM